MPRTDEAEHFINAVYSAVQEIPRGRVTTYGHIATLLGYRKLPPLSSPFRSPLLPPSSSYSPTFSSPPTASYYILNTMINCQQNAPAK